MMYQNETNEYGCPLCDQTGVVGVQNFDAIIARLAPDLRAAFEAERAACQAELDSYLAAGTNTSGSLQLELIAEIEPLTYAGVLIMRFEQLLARLGRPRLRELIDSLLPRSRATRDGWLHSGVRWRPELLDPALRTVCSIGLGRAVETADRRMTALEHGERDARPA